MLGTPTLWHHDHDPLWTDQADPTAPSAEGREASIYGETSNYHHTWKEHIKSEP